MTGTDTTRRDVARLDGGPAVEPEVRTLGEALVRAAASPGPDGGLVLVGRDGTERSRTYRRLLEDASRLLGGMRAAGASPGETVILQAADDLELLTAFWACVLGGLVPMPVGAGATADQRAEAPRLLRRVWEGYGRPKVVTGTGQPIAPEVAADPGWASAWLGDASSLLSHRADPHHSTGPQHSTDPDHPTDPHHHPTDPHHHRADPDDTAVLLLTSGSTGVPKAVVLSHRNVLSRTAATVRTNRLDATTRSFNWMPLDHVGGLIMFHARDTYLGCHQVHGRLEWVLEDPLRWLTLMDRHRVDTTWAPNFAFGLINDQADRLRGLSLDLGRLRYVMNGGEAIRGGAVRRFLELLAPFGLAGDVMYPGWGMSETSAGVADCEFGSSGTGDDRYVPVGRPQPGTSVRVVDERDAPLPVGVTGHLQVTGASVTAGYYRNTEQNRRSFTADGWFRSGDLAYVENGLLTVTGRADDVIELGGIACHGHEIEARVEDLDFVAPSYTVASVVTGRDGRSEELAVFFHQRGGPGVSEACRRIRDRVAETIGVEVHHVVPVLKEDVPKTGIGKLRRAGLRERFESARAKAVQENPL
ncbi:AMP-binding protein [Streptomyces sp. NPDC012825]|uniref:AMP-binding protein n=1 Tax=Streptomyces sp. NPDC012825 TaxID=3364851 RepID=UPI003673CD3D